MTPKIAKNIVVLGPKTVPKMRSKIPGDIDPSLLGHPLAQDGAKMALRWLKMPKMRPRWPQDGPRQPHDGPRCPQDAPRWPQDGSKMPQDDPKMAPRWPQMLITWLPWRPSSFSRAGGMRGAIEFGRSLALAKVGRVETLLSNPSVLVCLSLS